MAGEASPPLLGWRSIVRFQHNLVNETSKALPGSNLGWRFPTGLMGVKAV
jgi:hypothetical protein